MSINNEELISALNTMVDTLRSQRVDNEEVVRVGEADQTALSPFIGLPVLIRANLKGCQVGVLDQTDAEFLYLSPSRKLWRWQAAKGIALESVAVHGIAQGTRATAICENDALRLDDVCGITVLNSDIYNQIMEWPTSEQD